MLNKEKYIDKIIEIAIDDSNSLAVKASEPVTCSSLRGCVGCDFCNYDDTVYETCSVAVKEWLNKEYIEPESIDWTKIPVNAPVLVKNNENNDWTKRYFCKFEDGKVYTWMYGATSLTANGQCCSWNYVKLAENTTVAINWSEIPVDTLIFVRDDDSEDWLPRYFCDYDGDKIYTWDDGQTSWSSDCDFSYSVPWKQAKLV